MSIPNQERREALSQGLGAAQNPDEAFLMLISLTRRLSTQKLKQEIAANEANIQILMAAPSIVVTPGAESNAFKLTLANLNLEILNAVLKLREKTIKLDMQTGIDPYKSEFKEMVVLQRMDQLT